MQNSSSSKVDISDSNHFNREVLKCSEPVIVDFYADWCGPCKILGPILEAACTKEKCFKLAKVNVDSNQELSDEYKVSGIPHVILFFQGKEIMQFTGMDQGKFNEMVQQAKTLCKAKPFSGAGVVLDAFAQNQQEDLPDELFVDILNSLPVEPKENDTNSYNIIIKFNDVTIQRKFNPDDTIEHIILFTKCKIKTLNEIELFEPFPRKIYSGNGSINTSGISKNQILLVKFI